MKVTDHIFQLPFYNYSIHAKCGSEQFSTILTQVLKKQHLRYTHISYHRRGLFAIKLKGPNLWHVQKRKSGIVAILAIGIGI